MKRLIIFLLLLSGPAFGGSRLRPYWGPTAYEISDAMRRGTSSYLVNSQYEFEDALNWAAAGKTIIVLPGDYTTSTTLAKTGVNWWFMPGAKVTAAGCAMFDDGGNQAVFTVGGSGEFVGNTGIFKLTGTNSVVVMNCYSLHSTASNLHGVFNGDKGTIYLTVQKQIISNYDVFLNTGNPPNQTVYLTVPYICADDNVIENAGKVYITSDYISADNEVVNGRAVGFIRAKYIETLTTAPAVLCTTGTDLVIDFDYLYAPGVLLETDGNTKIELRNGYAKSEGAVCILTDHSGIVLRNVQVASSAATNFIQGEGTVEIQGTVTANKAIDPEIDLNGGGVFVNTAGDFRIIRQDVFFPHHAWNADRIRLGNYHIWVDATGDLRIKNGAPTGDTDGAVVGLQE